MLLRSLLSLSHQLLNDDLKLFPTWTQSGNTVKREISGSTLPSSTLFLIISKAPLLPVSQSAVATNMARYTLSSFWLRQVLQARRDGWWLTWPVPLHSSHTSLISKQVCQKLWHCSKHFPSMFFDDEARFWQDLQVCKSFTCSMNILWHDSAVFPDFVEYSTAHGKLHLLSMLVKEETIASVTRFSFKKSGLGLGFLLT